MSQSIEKMRELSAKFAEERKKHNREPRGDEIEPLTEEDERILDKCWAEVAKKMKQKKDSNSKQD